MSPTDDQCLSARAGARQRSGNQMALCLGVKEAAICGAPATCGRAAPASPCDTITKHVLVFSPRRRSGNGPVTRLRSAPRVELLDGSLSTHATLHQTDCDSNGARAEAAGSSARLRTEASTSGPLLVSARQTHASRRGAASGDARLTLAAPFARSSQMQGVWDHLRARSS